MSSSADGTCFASNTSNINVPQEAHICLLHHLPAYFGLEKESIMKEYAFTDKANWKDKDWKLSGLISISKHYNSI